MLATAALLDAMQRSGFAVGTALQQSSLPLAAILGLIVYHDRISVTAWVGVVITTIGLQVGVLLAGVVLAEAALPRETH